MFLSFIIIFNIVVFLQLKDDGVDAIITDIRIQKWCKIMLTQDPRLLYL